MKNKKKCTFVRMTSEHSKIILPARTRKGKILTKKMLEDRKKRKEEWQSWWK